MVGKRFKEVGILWVRARKRPDLHETYVSTLENPPEASTWLSGSQPLEERPCHSGPPAAGRPQAPDPGLIRRHARERPQAISPAAGAAPPPFPRVCRRARDRSPGGAAVPDRQPAAVDATGHGTTGCGHESQSRSGCGPEPGAAAAAGGVPPQSGPAPVSGRRRLGGTPSHRPLRAARGGTGTQKRLAGSGFALRCQVNPAQHILVGALRLYQWALSPLVASLFGPLARCRFQPTCSAYALEAVRIHGALRGTWLAICRLGRCHPWGGCGHDPVPPRRADTVCGPPVAPSSIHPSAAG